MIIMIIIIFRTFRGKMSKVLWVSRCWRCVHNFFLLLFLYLLIISSFGFCYQLLFFFFVLFFLLILNFALVYLKFKPSSLASSKNFFFPTESSHPLSVEKVYIFSIFSQHAFWDACFLQNCNVINVLNRCASVIKAHTRMPEQWLDTL